MSLHAVDSEQLAESANVRLVRVDEQHQPRYLALAAELEQSILGILATAGVTADDVPGLHGLLVTAARVAQDRGPGVA